MLDNLKQMTKDDILHAIGLQTRREPTAYVGPIIGLLGTGLLVGVGLGLLLAPKAGRELRRTMGTRFREIRGGKQHEDGVESKDEFSASGSSTGKRDREQDNINKQQPKRDITRVEAPH